MRMFASVCGGDDFADALLVKTLKARIALQILQMRAERPIGAERGDLLGGDLPNTQEMLQPRFRNAPPNPCG